MSQFKKGQVQTFDIKAKQLSNGVLYYIFESEGKDYWVRSFPYQRKTDRNKITCIVKSIDDDEPVFMQDIKVVIKELYKEGGSYDFTVRNDCRNLDYYEVIDDNGLRFRLTEWGDEPLRLNTKVRCKVTDINGVKVDLQLIGQDRQSGLPLLSPDDLLALDTLHTDPDIDLLAIYREHEVFFDDAERRRREGDPLWVITAIETVYNTLPIWLNSDFPHKRLTLSHFANMTTNLLENSDFLKNSDLDTLKRYQEKLSQIIRHSQDYIEAMQLITNDKHITYIKDLLQRLKTSGYLYEPEKKMRVLMSLFTLRQESVREYIQPIFNIIKEGQRNERFTSLFKNVFEQMLDIYIQDESAHVNTLTAAGNDEDRQRVKQLVEALAMRLLLSRGEHGEDTNVQTQLYRPKLYRLATLLTVDRRDTLLDKAYASLFNTYNLPLEYTWQDLDNINDLCRRLILDTLQATPNDIMTYEANNAVLSLTENSIQLSPAMRVNPQSVIPNGVLTWRNVEILLNERLKNRLSNSCAMNQMLRAWQEIDRTLFSPTQATRQRNSFSHLTPSPGDNVNIFITARDNDNKSRFLCAIDDDIYSGTGYIDTTSIVRYNVDADTYSFRDENGTPFLLKATVKTVQPDGKIVFSMEKEMDTFIYDTTELTSEYPCRVTKETPDNYLCISEFGFGVLLYRDKNPNLAVGDQIIVRVNRTWPNGNVLGNYLRHNDKPEEQVDSDNAFWNLLYDYSEGNRHHDFKDDQDDAYIDILTDSNVVSELIHILDRKAVQDNTSRNMYNYLALCRSLCLLLGDQHNADYYTERLNIVKALHEHCDNGAIDENLIARLTDDNSPIVKQFPDIKSKAAKIIIATTIGNSNANNLLWDIATHDNDENNRQLAQIALSHNLLRATTLHRERLEIRRKLNELLGVRTQLEDDDYIGREGQHDEFKTSIIYPAGNHMRPDKQQQINVLLQEINSFLNADGGRLWLGVNNEGYVSGLDADFKYLCNSEQYTEHNAHDKFENEVLPAIRNKMGIEVLKSISHEFVKEGQRTYFVLTIPQAERVIKLDDKVYQRVGASKYALTPEEIKALTAERQNA